MDLLLATRNRNKTREFAELLGRGFSVRDLRGAQFAEQIDESGGTFLENARIKAVAVSKASPGEIVIADDSGLEVDALRGAPGIRSARYAGERASDSENVRKLLRELRDVSCAKRTAHFVCAVAVMKSGDLLFETQGFVQGRISFAPAGENGFGYDPVFIPLGFDETFAQLLPAVKNEISHRAAAVRNLSAHLRDARF